MFGRMLKQQWGSLLLVLLQILVGGHAFQAPVSLSTTSAVSTHDQQTPSSSHVHVHAPKRARRSVQLSVVFEEDHGNLLSEPQQLVVNSFLRASRSSFKNVETMTNQLLNRQPVLAVAIFVVAGVLVAYLLGLVFLGGYMDTWNPVENDWIPYWDDEVLIITRKVGN